MGEGINTAYTVSFTDCCEHIFVNFSTHNLFGARRIHIYM